MKKKISIGLVILICLVLLGMAEFSHSQKPSKHMKQKQMDVSQKELDYMQGDYLRDVQGRKEFSRSYLKISAELRMPNVKPPMNSSILSNSSQATWEKGFVVDLNKYSGQSRTFEGLVEYDVRGVDPKDLQSTDRSRQIIIRFYDGNGRSFSETHSGVEDDKYQNLNVRGQIPQNQTIRGLVLFKTMRGVLGYTKLPPVRLNHH